MRDWLWCWPGLSAANHVPVAHTLWPAAPHIGAVHLQCCCSSPGDTSAADWVSITSASQPIPSRSRLCCELRPGTALRAAQGGRRVAAARQVAGDALRPARCACQRGPAGGGGRQAHGCSFWWLGMSRMTNLPVLPPVHASHNMSRCTCIRPFISPTSAVPPLHPLPMQATAWALWPPAAAALPCGCASPWLASM